jgi:hypothetical protein
MTKQKQQHEYWEEFGYVPQLELWLMGLIYGLLIGLLLWSIK